MSEEEVVKHSHCFYGILMRKWRPPNASVTEEWQVMHQIVLPKSYQKEVMSLACESPMAGHLGINT